MCALLGKLACRQGVAILMLSALSGCAPQGLFYWGDYESSLYDRYVANDFNHPEGRLQNTISDAESRHRPIPPGLCADYGFLLYKRGDKAGAIAYFDKERSLYPESAALMNKLIERVNVQKTEAVEKSDIEKLGKEDKP